MTEIEVSRITEEPLLFRFHVRVVDGNGNSTEHDVSLLRADHERLSGGYETLEALVRASFEFLLERESKESILASFDVNQISTFFPEFEREISRPS